jgi:hypothetical protein
MKFYDCRLPNNKHVIPNPFNFNVIKLHKNTHLLLFHLVIDFLIINMLFLIHLILM